MQKFAQGLSDMSHARPGKKRTLSILLSAKKLAAGIGSLVLSGMLAGCDPAPPPASRSAVPVNGGTLVYATDREPLCLEPHVFGDMPQALLAKQFLDSLVSMDAQGNIGPWLAKSWEVSADGLSYTFHLRDDVHFTDGTPFNAAAVKANLDHMANPKTQSSTAGGYIRQYLRTDVVDDYIAVVRLTTPYAAFLEVLAQSFLGIESPTALARPRDINCQSPVGSGPFKVVRWDRQNLVELVRNPDYNWAPATALHQGPAYLDRIVWKFIQEPSVRFASLQAGEVDVIENLPPESHAAARHNPELSLLIAQRPGNPTNGTLNITRAPFNDLRVREAFVRSADVEGALKSVYFNEFPRAGGPLSVATRFYSADFEHAQDYDPAKAARLLDEAGWREHDAEGYRLKDGKRLQVHAIINSASPPSDHTLWEQIQATTRLAGFELIIHPMSSVQFLQKQADWDYDVIHIYWVTNTADVLRIIFSSEFVKSSWKGGFHQNSAGLNEPELDQLVQQALVSQDPEQRRALYYKAQALASREYLQLTTYPQSARVGIYKTTQGVRLEPSLALTSFYDAWVNK